jgi:hypothetical protein
MPASPLSQEEIRELLRECVTAVEPGQMLVIRVSPDFAPNQVQEYGDMVAAWAESHAPDVKVLVVAAEELGVAQREGEVA